MQNFSTISNSKESANSKPLQGRRSSFFKPLIQPKLTINQPNDIYEQEADAVAERVMRMPATKTETAFFQPKPVSVTPVQKKCASCEEEEKLQMKTEQGNGNGNVLVAPSLVHEVISSSGKPLEVRKVLWNQDLVMILRV